MTPHDTINTHDTPLCVQAHTSQRQSQNRTRRRIASPSTTVTTADTSNFFDFVYATRNVLLNSFTTAPYHTRQDKTQINANIHAHTRNTHFHTCTQTPQFIHLFTHMYTQIRKHTQFYIRTCSFACTMQHKQCEQDAAGQGAMQNETSGKERIRSQACVKIRRHARISNTPSQI